jgi:hypothetical protein
MDNADASQTEVKQASGRIDTSPSSPFDTHDDKGLQQILLGEFNAPGSAGPVIAYIVLGLISLAAVCLHGFAPPQLWKHIDIFSMEHHTKEGDSVVKRRTRLGFAFTIAYLPVTAMLIIGLNVSNRPEETASLQAFNSLPASTKHLIVQLALPLEPHVVDACRNVNMTTDITGCNQTAMFDPATCTFIGSGCELGLNTVFKFTIPWNQRWVEWNVTTETASLGQGKTISGQVVSADRDRLIKDINIDIQAMASYRNDTTSSASNTTTTGYDIYPLPYKAPNTRVLTTFTTVTTVGGCKCKVAWKYGGVTYAGTCSMEDSSKPWCYIADGANPCTGTPAGPIGGGDDGQTWDFCPASAASGTTGPATSAWSNKQTRLIDGSTTSITDDWSLEITLRRSPLVHMVNVSRPLAPFSLLSLCLTTVISFLGVWRIVFGAMEYYFSMKKARRRRRGDGGGTKGGINVVESKSDDDSDPADGGVELQTVGVQILARTASAELFGDKRSPSVVNPAYGIDGDHTLRTAKLEKRANEAEARADAAESRVDETTARVDVAEKRADEAELIAQKLEARMLELERKIEFAAGGEGEVAL